MYERSAIILERYFAERFCYVDKINLKNNYNNYCDLIEGLEKYQEVSETEDKIIKEYEDIAGRIKQIQKSQSTLYKKAIKLQEERNSLFENIDESTESLTKKLDKIQEEMDKNGEEMKPLDSEFINVIQEFNEKSKVRSECGKKRRKVEKEYRDIFDKAVNEFNEIDEEKIGAIKRFLAEDTNVLNEEIKNAMLKNGENEKVPFDLDVIENSILLGQNVHRKEVKILVSIYEKTKNLLNEINNGSVKINKYKKIAKNMKNELTFIAAQKEYLVQFLDNERLSVSLGKKEHKKLMKEACEAFENDVEKINNLYELLTREIAGKATQKMYKELYNDEYLKDLKKQELEFENKISELNLVGKIINPIYWRIEAIEKIYLIFDEIVINEYERDLSKFKIEENDSEENLAIETISEDGKEEQANKNKNNSDEELNNQYDDVEEYEYEYEDEYDDDEDDEDEEDDDYEDDDDEDEDDEDEDNDDEDEDDEDADEDDEDDDDEDDDDEDDEDADEDDEDDEDEDDEDDDEDDDDEDDEDDEDDDEDDDDEDDEDDEDEDDDDDEDDENTEDEDNIMLKSKKKKTNKGKTKTQKSKDTKKKSFFGKFANKNN